MVQLLFGQITMKNVYLILKNVVGIPKITRLLTAVPHLQLILFVWKPIENCQIQKHNW